jgi:hypothetical protein
LFAVKYMPRKDLMSRTGGPPLRTAVMKITRPIDEELERHLSVEKD